MRENEVKEQALSPMRWFNLDDESCEKEKFRGVGSDVR